MGTRKVPERGWAVRVRRPHDHKIMGDVALHGITIINGRCNCLGCRKSTTSRYMFPYGGTYGWVRKEFASKEEEDQWAFLIGGYLITKNAYPSLARYLVDHGTPNPKKLVDLMMTDKIMEG